MGLFNFIFGSSRKGKCGKDVTWRLEEGTLTISGKGAMEDYSSPDDPPWFNINSKSDDSEWANVNITNVVILNGVTTIGNHALWGCTRLNSVAIPNSVTSIGDNAFDACESTP